METRTMISLVTFRRPFRLSALAGEQPAGTYVVRREQAMLDMMTALGWWQTSVTIEIRRGGASEHVAIDGRELRAALAADGDPLADPQPVSL
jgi:hypothetical protein